MEIVCARYPYHDILAEESVGTKTGPRRRAAAEGRLYTWLVDPLDGTTNYCRHYPCFSVSIALSHRGEVILGVVYDPLRDQMFKAQRGRGPTCYPYYVRKYGQDGMAAIWLNYPIPSAWEGGEF